MMALVLHAALAASASAPTVVQQALERAAPAGAEVRVAEYRAQLPGGCRLEAAEVGAVSRSGSVPVRLRGADCAGWATARVVVVATVAVSARAIPAGQPLEGAVRLERRELRGSTVPAPELGPKAVAARAIAAGQVLDETAVAAAGARRAGESIAVVVAHGSLRLEREGRLLPCARGRGCALLPGGARVEGTLDGDRLLVEVP